MNKKLIKEAEMYIRKKANDIWQPLNPEGTDDFTKTCIKQAEHLADMADELEKITNIKTCKLKSFIEHLNRLVEIGFDDDDFMQYLYSKNFVLSFNSCSVEIPFDATSFNEFMAALEDILSEM